MSVPDHPTLSFSSPHLLSIKERVRVNGEPLSDDLWISAFNAIVAALEAPPAIRLTYFESTWILFLWAARELNTSVHIVEAGLGGRWDATNILTDTLAVLTPVDYDHTEVLGNTLTAIAGDKSGIVKPGARVVIGPQPSEALTVYQQAIFTHQAHGSFFGPDFRWITDGERTFCYQDDVAAAAIPSLTLRVPGLHQRDNACVAIRAARLLFPSLSADSVRRRLAACTIPGRQQFFPGKPDILLDVAHNPVSFRALAETLKAHYGSRRIRAVIGMMREKDARTSLQAIRDRVENILVVELHSPRSMKTADLAAIAAELGMPVETPASPEAAFQILHGDPNVDLGLIAGSFYLAGDYLTWRKSAGIA